MGDRLEAIQNGFFSSTLLELKKIYPLSLEPSVCDKYFQVKQLGIFSYQPPEDLFSPGISF